MDTMLVRRRVVALFTGNLVADAATPQYANDPIRGVVWEDVRMFLDVAIMVLGLTFLIGGFAYIVKLGRSSRAKSVRQADQQANDVKQAASDLGDDAERSGMGL